MVNTNLGITFLLKHEQRVIGFEDKTQVKMTLIYVMKTKAKKILQSKFNLAYCHIFIFLSKIEKVVVLENHLQLSTRNLICFLKTSLKYLSWELQARTEKS